MCSFSTPLARLLNWTLWAIGTSGGRDTLELFSHFGSNDPISSDRFAFVLPPRRRRQRQQKRRMQAAGRARATVLQISPIQVACHATPRPRHWPAPSPRAAQCACLANQLTDQLTSFSPSFWPNLQFLLFRCSPAAAATAIAGPHCSTNVARSQMQTTITTAENNSNNLRPTSNHDHDS